MYIIYMVHVHTSLAAAAAAAAAAACAMAAAVIASLVLGTAVLVLVVTALLLPVLVLFAMHGGTVGCAVAVSMRLASDAAPALLNCCVELLALGVVTGGCCFFFNAS